MSLSGSSAGSFTTRDGLLERESVLSQQAPDHGSHLGIRVSTRQDNGYRFGHSCCGLLESSP
jgi:hypothetical protein